MARGTWNLVRWSAVVLGISCGIAQPSRLIELRSAKELKGRIVNNEEVRELIGDVHFVQPASSGGLIRVWCDRALRYMAQNKVELFGNVKIIRDSVTITSKEGVYYGDSRRVEVHTGVRLERGKAVLTARNGEHFIDEKRSHFTGDVLLVDSTSTISCNDLTYFESETKSIATDAVRVVNKGDGSIVLGDSLIHYEQQSYTRVLKNPKFIAIDTSGTGIIDTMLVVSRMMESFQDSVPRFIATDSVLLSRGDLSGQCGKATYFTAMDYIVLQIQPVVWQGENQVSGDSMVVRLEEKVLQSVYVRGRAMALSHADSIRRKRFDQLTGRELTMFFANNKVQQVDVQKNATSLYYLFEDDRPNGVNKSSGDRIIIEFQQGKVDRIKIIGGVQGQYYPERMIFGREPEYNLDGFRWIALRPTRRLLTIFRERYD
ncbi:MAG: OstA-like protein [Bacteroidota bacterium]